MIIPRSYAPNIPDPVIKGPYFERKHELLKLGSEGYQVLKLQQYLTKIGLYKAPIDS
jgi:hypothetical protein